MVLSEDGEARLIRSAAGGDRNAFGQLMSPYIQGLYGFICCRISGDVRDDVFQETILAAWLGIAGYNGTSSFKTWCFALASHKINDHLRRRYCAQSEPEDILAQIPSPGSLEDGTVSRCDVEGALARLSPDERELVRLVFREEQSYTEAAEILGIPPGTVKSRMAAIKKKLKNILGEGYYRDKL